MNSNTTILSSSSPLNDTIISLHDQIPTLHQYYTNLTTFTTISIIIGILIFLLNFITFLFTLKQCRKRIHKQYLNLTIFLNILYPIISFVALLTLLIPKLIFICHTIMHLLFTIGVLIYYQLCYLYVDGEDNFLKENDAILLELRTPPCCCCCLCIHQIAPTKIRLKFLSYIIMQLPFIQFLIMITLNVIYIHEVDIFNNCNLYFAPFMLISILLAIWGLNILTRMIGAYHKDYNMKQKFICLQLILILCKFQYVILNYCLDLIDFGGEYPITNTVYKQGIINLAILLEMFPLSLFAKWAYKMPTYL